MFPSHTPRSGRRAAGHLPSPFLPCLPASCCPFPKPEAPVLVQLSLTLGWFPDSQECEGGELPREGQLYRGTLLQSHLPSLPLALQPHPRVNFCPLPPEHCYQPPGVPEDRGPTWVGSHGAPQRLQVRSGDEGRVSQGQGERSLGRGCHQYLFFLLCLCLRDSLQTGGSSALAVWMLR